VDRWITEDLDSVGNGDCSMILDASGNPQVAFVGGGGLSHGVRSKDSWTAGLVDNDGGGHNAIALDKLGKIHICYCGEKGELKVAREK